jgi:uncharacterized protein YndB with AHSA1/START domain
MFKWLFGGKDKEPGPEVSGPPELIVVEETVAAPVEYAFEVFVDRLSSWWPREYTWAKDKLAEIGIEPQYEGRCYERSKDGTESQWGTVLTVARPEHIVFAWQINADRSAEPNVALASRVDIRFTSIDADTTSIVLVHRDFPRHGPGWQNYRANMASKNGWPRILEHYKRVAAEPRGDSSVR